MFFFVNLKLNVKDVVETIERRSNPLRILFVFQEEIVTYSWIVNSIESHSTCVSSMYVVDHVWEWKRTTRGSLRRDQRTLSWQDLPGHLDFSRFLGIHNSSHEKRKSRQMGLSASWTDVSMISFANVVGLFGRQRVLYSLILLPPTSLLHRTDKRILQNGGSRRATKHQWRHHEDY